MKTEKNKTRDEAQIRQQVACWIKAFRTKDLNLMMSLYDSRIVSFDVVPPLQVVGRDAWRKTWEHAFESFQDSIDFEVRDLNITTSNDLAFSQNLLRLNATRANGQKVDYWERLTFCFRKIDGKWLITHEHVSVPADFKNDKAVLNLKPE